MGKLIRFFAIMRSKLIINTCKSKFQKSFFAAAFHWRHLIGLAYTIDQWWAINLARGLLGEIHV